MSATEQGRIPHGPRGLPWLGSLLDFKQDPPGFLVTLAERYGDVARFTIGHEHFTLFRAPADVKEILQTRHREFSKRTPGYEALAEWLGQGILTAEGDAWLKQRRLVQPAFHRHKLETFAATMTRQAAALRDRWERRAALDPLVDVSKEMTALTLSIVTNTLFGERDVASAAVVGAAVEAGQRRINARITRTAVLSERLPLPGRSRQRDNLSEMDRAITRLIESARANPGGDDILAMLLAARDEEGRPLSDAQVRDEVLTLFVAGHETTATALAWTFFLLSRHPLVARRLHEEVDRVLSGRLPTFADVPQLTYTRQVIDESLRIFPPAWMTARRAEADVEVGGAHVPGGSLVVVSPYVTHRDPRHWPNPEGFDPDRFAASVVHAPFAYIPFGGGPRKCIGDAFALLEITLVVATLSQRFELDLVPGRRVQVEPLVTLRPRGGIDMRLIPRRR